MSKQKKITTANFYLMWACLLIAGLSAFMIGVGAGIALCELVGWLDEQYSRVGFVLCLGGVLSYQCFCAAAKGYLDRWRYEMGLKPYDWGNA